MIIKEELLKSSKKKNGKGGLTMPRRTTTWWDEDVFDDIEQTEYHQEVADQMLEDGGLAGWEAALLIGYDDAG